MNHSILTKEFLGHDNWFIEIELFPESEIELKAIQNLEAVKASEDESELLENYLHVALQMSLLKLVRQKKNVFAVTATTASR